MLLLLLLLIYKFFLSFLPILPLELSTNYYPRRQYSINAEPETSNDKMPLFISLNLSFSLALSLALCVDDFNSLLFIALFSFVFQLVLDFVPSLALALALCF